MRRTGKRWAAAAGLWAGLGFAAWAIQTEFAEFGRDGEYDGAVRIERDAQGNLLFTDMATTQGVVLSNMAQLGAIAFLRDGSAAMVGDADFGNHEATGLSAVRLTNASGVDAHTILGGTGAALLLINPNTDGAGTLTLGAAGQSDVVKIAGLTSGGFVKTSGGDGTLSVDASTYLSAVPDPMVPADGVQDLDGALDVASGGISMTLGADSDATSRTNETTKYARIAGAHYLTGEEPVSGLFVDSHWNGSYVYIGGGGNSGLNAATRIGFFAASTYTTLTGTGQAFITSSGFGIGPDTSPDWFFDCQGPGHFDGNVDSDGDAVLDGYVSTGANELLAQDAVRHTISAGEASAHSFTEFWNKATTKKVVALSAATVAEADPNDTVYSTGHAGRQTQVRYNGTTVTVDDVSGAWSANDIVTIHIAYEK